MGKDGREERGRNWSEGGRGIKRGRQEERRGARRHSSPVRGKGKGKGHVGDVEVGEGTKEGRREGGRRKELGGKEKGDSKLGRKGKRKRRNKREGRRV